MIEPEMIPVIANHKELAHDRRSGVPFGALVRQFRVAAGLTQEELAARATISVRAISDLERAKRRRPQRETLRLIADALNLTPQERSSFEDAAHGRYVALPRLLPQYVAPNNIALPLTPLIGRESDLAAIDALLSERSTRLVTITGAGGMGKTRIVLDLAVGALASFPDGVFFVPLAPICDPALVLSTIAQTFGLEERGAQDLREALITQLHRKRLLLVLDNFEHVIPAAVQVADLLAACEGLKVLVTSRAALHIRGEQEYRLRPLPLPDLAVCGDLAQVRRSPAVTLFMDRARAINRNLALDPFNAQTVVQICARLDGLPLALELAAARTRVLQPAELLARLEHRFAVLSDGSTDLPERQQTMRRAIDWSYDLLPPEEQRLFRWLAIFAGGCTLEAAEALGNSLLGQPVNLLSGLSSLVDKSLLQAEARGETTRFTMLETVRAYGLEQLAALEEVAAVRRAHATYFLDMVTALDPNAIGATYIEGLARIDADHDNLRVALAWACDQGEADIAMRLVAALWRFWYTRGYLREGRTWIEAVFALPDASNSPARDRAVALRGAATLALRISDTAAAEAHARNSVATFRTIDDPRGMAAALNILGSTAFERNDFHAAIAYYTEALGLRRMAGDRQGSAGLLGNLGRTARFLGEYERAAVYYREGERLKRESGDTEGLASNLGNQGHMARDCGDPHGARPLIEESLALYEQIGEKRGIGIALTQLALIACDTGDLAVAHAYVERSLTIRRQIDDRRGIAQSLAVLGDIALATHDPARAWSHYHDALRVNEEIRFQLGIAECLERFAQLLVARQLWETAAHCLGAASAIRGRIDAPALPVDRPAIEAASREIRAAIGVAQWDEADAVGRDLPLGDLFGALEHVPAAPVSAA